MNFHEQPFVVKLGMYHWNVHVNNTKLEGLLTTTVWIRILDVEKEIIFICLENCSMKSWRKKKYNGTSSSKNQHLIGCILEWASHLLFFFRNSGSREDPIVRWVSGACICVWNGKLWAFLSLVTSIFVVLDNFTKSIPFYDY